MGGGGQTKEARQTQQRFDQQYQPYVATGGQRSQETYDYGRDAYGDVGEFARSVMAGDFGGGGGGGGGGYAEQVYIPENLTPEQIADLEGTYREFNTTGGWGDQRQTNFRGRALGAADAPYQQAMRQAGVGQAVQGGWGTGVNTANLALQRGAAQSRNQALLGAETEMASAIDSGRKWGATGLEGTTKYRVGRQDDIGRAKVEQENARGRAAAAARASAAASEDEAFRRRMMGANLLMDSAGNYNTAGLPYYNAQGSGLGGWGSLSSNFTQQRQPSAFERGVGMVSGLAGAAGAAAAPWLNRTPKKPGE